MFKYPHQFEPLIPATIPDILADKAAQIVRESLLLAGAAHPSSRATIRERVRSMNSYYSNKIEGQSTHPQNIERALLAQSPENPELDHLQRVALAHIDAERDLEQRVLAGESALSSRFLIAAHHALYSRLEPSDRTSDHGHIVVPGEVRTVDVVVGAHLPPAHASLPAFFLRLDEVYDHQRSWDSHLLHLACLHHRAAWTHPFRDGNGRAVRLQSHCALWSLSDGLWSPSRGLARGSAEYYARLSDADAARQGNYDGRGNLSTAALVAWMEFFLDICLDQVTFMGRMLQLDGMKRRIEALILFMRTENPVLRMEAVLPLFHLFAAGPLTRKEFEQMSGLGVRTAQTLRSELLKTGLIKSETKLGPLTWGLPLDSMVFLFPELYPEANTSPG